MHLEGTVLEEAQLEGAAFYHAHLERANLRNAHLEGTCLISCHLEGANLYQAHLEGIRKPTHDKSAHCLGQKKRSPLLLPADLRRVYFDAETNLREINLGEKQPGYALLCDVHWGEVNLSVLDWGKVVLDWVNVPTLDTPQDRVWRKELRELQSVVRANRQLASMLRNQGLNEEAARFSYQAQTLQRGVWRRQGKFLQYLGSWILWLVAGYGYRPLRSFLIYLILIIGFAIAYFLVGPGVGVPFSPLGALVFSVTSFHGRGFFPGHGITLDDPLTVVAATEAVVGLFIEISFIATFTQRYFGK